MLLQSGQTSEAETVFSELLRRNPENHDYYRQMERALGVQDDEEKRIKMYEGYGEKFPRATAPQRLPLETATGENQDSEFGRYGISLA